MALLLGSRPAKFDGRRRESQDWADARRQAHLALSELEEAGLVVRVVTRRDALFMIADDAIDLVAQTRQAIG